MIGQMNKSDEIAGLRALEHLVDAVLVLEGEGADELRCLVATKNRFGSTGEMGFFTMTEAGLASIENPSAYFCNETGEGRFCFWQCDCGFEGGLSSCHCGNRKSGFPFLHAVSLAHQRNHEKGYHEYADFHSEQRGGIKLYDKNVVIKTTGGLYLKEQAANLAVLMSIASSVYDKPIPSDWAFLADVGLTGELKRVPSVESRIKELDRMGFKQVFIPAGGMQELHLENIRVVEANFLSQLLNHVFGKKEMDKRIQFFVHNIKT